jgi:hypothetical protein
LVDMFNGMICISYVVSPGRPPCLPVPLFSKVVVERLTVVLNF